MFPNFNQVEMNHDHLVKFDQPVTTALQPVYKMPLCLKFECSPNIRKKIRIAKHDKEKMKLLQAEAELTVTMSDEDFLLSKDKLPPFKKVAVDKRYRSQIRGVKFG